MGILFCIKVSGKKWISTAVCDRPYHLAKTFVFRHGFFVGSFYFHTLHWRNMKLTLVDGKKTEMKVGRVVQNARRGHSQLPHVHLELLLCAMKKQSPGDCGSFSLNSLAATVPRWRCMEVIWLGLSPKSGIQPSPNVSTWTQRKAA